VPLVAYILLGALVASARRAVRSAAASLPSELPLDFQFSSVPSLVFAGGFEWNGCRPAR